MKACSSTSPGVADDTGITTAPLFPITVCVSVVKKKRVGGTQSMDS